MLPCLIKTLATASLLEDVATHLPKTEYLAPFRTRYCLQMLPLNTKMEKKQKLFQLTKFGIKHAIVPRLWGPIRETDETSRHLMPGLVIHTGRHQMLCCLLTGITYPHTGTCFAWLEVPPA